MRKVIGLFVLINIVLVAWLGCMYFLAETGPFHPGQLLFNTQETAENWRVKLAGSPLKKAELTFELVDRRLADLAQAVTPDQISETILAFDRVLSDAIQLIESVSPAEQELLYQRMEVILVQGDIVLASLELADNSQLVDDLMKKIAYLSEAASPQDVQAVVAVKKVGPASVVAQIISFLGNDVVHDVFPLEEGHANVDCMACHNRGEYVTTPSNCSACHEIKADKYDVVGLDLKDPFILPAYPDHFEGECSDCHGTLDWVPTSFDHRGTYECLSCHAQDLPKVAVVEQKPFFINMPLLSDAKVEPVQNPDHYPGDCEICHTSTTTWKEVSFGHETVTECESCHSYQLPAEHFEGACTNCHSDYKDWVEVQVKHELYPDCASCHLEEKPLMHYEGTCSNCHNAEDWSQNYFNHAGYSACTDCHVRPAAHYPGACDDCHSTNSWTKSLFEHGATSSCAGCHITPAGHYPGECLMCHTTSSWTSAFFDHFDVANCLNCHTSETPEDHFTNSCLVCHTVADWQNLIFEHIDSADCLSCHKSLVDHYVGQCSNCHVVSEWAAVDFDHTGYDDCATCHTVPVNHYIGLCLNCHTLESWVVEVMDHTGLTDCILCHESPKNHYPGTCTLCHGFKSWLIINFNHVNADNCTGCHSAPSNHFFPGQCSNCHNTTDWSKVTFNHTGYTNCNACHLRPAGHPRGQCSKCHNTKSWTDSITPLPGELDILEPFEDLLGILEPVLVVDPSTPVPSTDPDTSVPVPVVTEEVPGEDEFVPPVVEPTPEPTDVFVPPIVVLPVPTVNP